MSEAARIDSLDIQIKSDAKEASGELTSLASTLAEVTKSLSSLSSKIRESKKSTDDGKISVSGFVAQLRKMGLTGVAGEVKQISQEVEKLNLPKLEQEMGKVADKLEDVGQTDLAEKVGSVAESIEELGTISGKSKYIEDFAKQLSSMGYTNAASELRDLGMEMRQLEMPDVAAKMGELADRLESIGETDAAARLREIAESAEEMEVAEVDASEETEVLDAKFRELETTTSRVAKSFKKFLHSIGRIAVYRAIRTAIKNLSAAIKEGLTNLYNYSQEVGTAFAPAVDNLRRHVNLLKNAFATALRPVLEALIPVVIRLVDALSRAADWMAQVLSLLTGNVDENGRYTKAVLSDLEQSNEEAKELRRTLLGFDEINRLDGDTGSSKESASPLQFVQADIGESAAKAAEFIKSIPWDKVRDALVIAGQVLLLIKGIQIVGKLWEAAKAIGAIIGKITPLGVLIAAIIAVFALWGDKISAWCRQAKKDVDDFFDSISNTGLQGWNAFVTLIKDIVDLVLETVGTVADLVYNLFHGNFAEAAQDLNHLVFTLIKGIVLIAVDAINLILGFVSDLVNGVVLAAQWVYNNGIVPAINWIIRAFKNVGIWLHNAWIDLKIAFNTAIKWILEQVNWLLEKITVAVNAVISAMNDVLGTEIEPVHLEIDTSTFDERIDELEAMKLPPIDQDVDFVAKWDGTPEPVKLHIDTKPIEDGLNAAEKAVGETISRITSAIAGAVGGGSNGYTDRKAGKTVYIQQFAGGGFPSAGSLFVAGEAGPELVTSVNGQTGVWNSDQLVQAMYAAMSAALQANPQGGGDIYLDGDVIYRNTVRRNNNRVRATGRSALLT